MIRRPKRQRIAASLFAGLALLVAAAQYWNSTPDSEQTTRLLYSSVVYGDIEHAVTAAGTLQPSRFVDVGAQVSGQLEELYVDVGDNVIVGELLAEIDATVQENRVKASRANLRALESQLSARKSELALTKANAERQVRLIGENASSQQNYDTAMNLLTKAHANLMQLESQIEQSRASLASDKALLGYSKIYAPVAGTVTSVYLRKGQTLNASQQTPMVLRLADLSTMTVEAEVSEADIGKLRDNMPVYFTTLGSGERRWCGILRQVLPTPVVINGVVLFTALFDVPNEDGSLLPDMTAQVFFVIGSAKNVLKVPIRALNFRDHYSGDRNAIQIVRDASTMPAGLAADSAVGGRKGMDGESRGSQWMTIQDRAWKTRSARSSTAYVRLLREDGTLTDRTIEIGLKTRIWAEVLSGLQEGDRVVAGLVSTVHDSRRRN